METTHLLNPVEIWQRSAEHLGFRHPTVVVDGGEAMAPLRRAVARVLVEEEVRQLGGLGLRLG
jgi:hypothetical protein